MSTAIISHSDCLLHDMGAHHPESPARLIAVREHLLAAGMMDLLDAHDAPHATREQLERVHPAPHIDAIEAAAPHHGIIYLDPDTAMNPHSLDAALRAAGAVVLATDLVMTGKATTAFCNVRPPGHHAEHNRAMGFCFFNNIAVGVAHALEFYGLERVAVIDFDVHHGNGTEDIFKNDKRVLMVSTFQHPFYPHSGTQNPAPNMVNIPLSAGSGGATFRDVVAHEWLPALELFKPQLIFISAGFDAHREDEMASLKLIEDDYAWVTNQIRAVADKYAEGRIVSALEGGYALGALGRSAVTHIKALGNL